MKIALVTTCLNEMGSVHQWINDVLSQTLQPDVISIVDAGSGDGTVEVLQKWAKHETRLCFEVRLKCTVAQGRNHAISNTDADIIVSTDMGCRLDNCWFEHIIAEFLRDDAVMVVAGNYRYLYPQKRTVSVRVGEYIYGFGPSKLGPGFLPSSRSIAYRRTVWEKLDGYPEDLSYAGDDTVFALQIQHEEFKTSYAQNAMVSWLRPGKVKAYWNEAFGYARGGGEALIATPKILERYPNRISKGLGTIYACYCALIRSPRGLLRAFDRGDIIAMPLIPFLIYGCAKNSLSGYKLGMREGAIRCKACRKRLHG